MIGHDIVVIGASAGGVEALSTLAAGLPADLPASVFVVLHIPPYATSVMPLIMSRAGRLPAVHAVDGEPILPGRIYIAPPDHHLLLKDGRVCLSRGAQENGHRPAIDPLFRSAALAYGPRVIGVILSGSLDDGTAGLAAVKERGGIAVVQDPADALYPGMPTSAVDAVEVDYVRPLREIPPLIVRLVREPASVGNSRPVPEQMEEESEIAELDMRAIEQPNRPGELAEFGCPLCGGALWELHEGSLVRFRCRVGHAWSPASLLVEQRSNLEAALWTALRALEEQRAFNLRLMERARTRRRGLSAERFEEQAREAQRGAALIRAVLLGTDVAEEAEDMALTEERFSSEPPDSPAPSGE